MIDDRGRLFGRLNLIDAGAVVLILLAAAGVYVGYGVAKLPRAPDVVTVDPPVQPEGSGLVVRLRGDHFLPFLRAFVRRSGNAPLLVHDTISAPRLDEYAFVNATQATFLAESPSIAQVRLPDNLAAGTYDLLFFDETRQVGAKMEAFTLVPMIGAVVHAGAPLEVVARFVANPDTARLVKVGDADVATRGDAASSAAKVVAVAPAIQRPARSVVIVGERTASVTDPIVTLDATLQVPAALKDGTWFYRGRPIRSGLAITFDTASYAIRGWILTVTERKIPE